MSTDKARSVLIGVLAMLLLCGIGAAVYLSVFRHGQRSGPIVLMKPAGVSTIQTRAVPDDVRAKLAAIRAQIEQAGAARGMEDSLVVDAGFAHIGANLNDPAVASFDPLSGFTHYSVSTRDQAETVLLIERVDEPRGGLNLDFDPATNTVTKVTFWGSTTTKR
jgi:hypothetical protein